MKGYDAFGAGTINMIILTVQYRIKLNCVLPKVIRPLLRIPFCFM